LVADPLALRVKHDHDVPDSRPSSNSSQPAASGFGRITLFNDRPRRPASLAPRPASHPLAPRGGPRRGDAAGAGTHASGRDRGGGEFPPVTRAGSRERRSDKNGPNK